MKDSNEKGIKEKIEHKEGKKYILNIRPFIKKYSKIELIKIAKIEEKLNKVIIENNRQGKTTKYIRQNDAENLIQWVVQNARFNFAKKRNLKEASLRFCCGLGQAYTGIALEKMGLKPFVINLRELFEKTSHALIIVEIPVKNINGKLENKKYLLDTTYRQFFVRKEYNSSSIEKPINDKKYSNYVYATPGYWLLKMKNGRKFAEKLLYKGFVELTEKNAKLYCDSFVLSSRKRKKQNDGKVPNVEELKIKTSGRSYIENLTNEKFKKNKFDPNEEQLKRRGIKIVTPLMQKKELNEKYTIEKEIK